MKSFIVGLLQLLGAGRQKAFAMNAPLGTVKRR